MDQVQPETLLEFFEQYILINASTHFAECYLYTIFFLYLNSPCILANLWDVTDRDIDRFTEELLKSWLAAKVSVSSPYAMGLYRMLRGTESCICVFFIIPQLRCYVGLENKGFLHGYSFTKKWPFLIQQDDTNLHGKTK